ncbi:hypothetical protein FSP39_013282 [Pinctada imbricata]|uniref:Uncharacterized protein n=1 Tax=Pinctada imbricata TaxID=66713 RepID=A0AA88Y711_PINIB|nr:hypothetical protein FSP39_013282 [Pinctada imbricata]
MENKGRDLRQHQVAAPTSKPQNINAKSQSRQAQEETQKGQGTSTHNIETSNTNGLHMNQRDQCATSCRLRTAICHGNSRWSILKKPSRMNRAPSGRSSASSAKQHYIGKARYLPGKYGTLIC